MFQSVPDTREILVESYECGFYKRYFYSTSNLLDFYPEQRTYLPGNWQLGKCILMQHIFDLTAA